jgi:universal stress protein A
MATPYLFFKIKRETRGGITNWYTPKFLLIRRNLQMLPLKRILCPIDFSEPSLAALEAAGEFAHNFDAELRVLNVVPRTPLLPTDMVVMSGNDLYPSDKQLCEEALENINLIITERLPNQVRAFGEVKLGNAAQEIVSTAADENVDLIVIGTHGKSGWRHLAFGSVAEKIVRTAHRPVLTVHGNSSISAATTAQGHHSQQ